MSGFIFLSLCAIIGITLALLDLSTKDWQFWVISSCIICSYILGGI